MNVLTMKVFVHFENYRETFDIPSDLTVRGMKQKVKENFLVQLSDDKQIHCYLELKHGGAALQDCWFLRDVGIISGSTIECLIKSKRRPDLHVFSAVTGETLPITLTESLPHMTVAQLKTTVSSQSGLPVSSFRLSTLSQVQLYDCNRLHDYAIDAGNTIRLDPWEGWLTFLHGCLLGHRLAVQGHLSEEKLVMRFQLRVALYIAASLGHLDLAGWLLERGVHAEEPVGVHPYRQWCHQTSHRDSGKCPIHVAVENCQLHILKLFITKNLLALVCQDPDGREPLKIAIQHGHRECVRYLANKLFSAVSLSNVSLPMRMYLQVKRWVRAGQKRTASNQFNYSSVPRRAKVGGMLLVDGFNQPQASSKVRKTKSEAKRKITTKAVQSLLPINNLLSPSKSKQEQHQSQTRWKENDKGNTVPLLPVTTDKTPTATFVGCSTNNNLTTSAEFFSQHCCRTPRENAMYYLKIASTFTEKPWSKQLRIARTLARKHVHCMT